MFPICIELGNLRWLFLVVIWLWSATLAVIAQPMDYLRDVQPLLEERCYPCHGPEKRKGGLRLDIKVAAWQGGDSGDAAIVPGHADQSPLFRLVSSSDEQERMPPPNAEEAPLTSEELKTLRSWIDAGADWPESSSVVEVANPGELQVTEADRQHWAFRPLAHPEPPVPSDTSWPQTPVDAFIRQAQEANGLLPSKPADPRALIRRLYLNMVGLPPSPDEMRHWLRRMDQSSTAAESLVESLLYSPHYGERWARHWLDVARYADSNGMEIDADRPNAYRFRDFVIRALNDDLPFDTFIRWQLAGDEIAPDHPDAIAATGFLAAGVNTILPDKQMVEEKLRNRANELDDIVSTTGQAMLGLTLACCRCHDHKYDPVSSRDYYRITRIFTSGDRSEVPLVSPEKAAEHEKAMADWQKALDQVQQERDQWLKEARQSVETRLRKERIDLLDISAAEKQLLIDSGNGSEAKKLNERFKKDLIISNADYVAALPQEKQKRWEVFNDRLDAIRKRKPRPLPMAYAFADFGPEPEVAWFFERGNFLARNEKMDFGFLTVLTSGKDPKDYWQEAKDNRLRSDTTYQRRALADWMTDLEHGAGALLTRVMVNRVWQQHFGEGLVRTPSDFGTRGERPTHPELLEWLASEFVRSGWSIKHLHRLILNSATYQQSSEYQSAMAPKDPENRLLWRQNMVRLEAEVLRDAMLAVSGNLNQDTLGPSFKPPIQGEAMQARNVKNPYPNDVRDTFATRRRSVYMFHKRVVQYPLMQAFDAPDAQQSCGRRMNTTVAPQALALLNDPFVRLRGGDLAKRIQSEVGNNLEEQVKHAFQLAFNRSPDLVELFEARSFLEDRSVERKQQGDTNASMMALTDFCHALFGLNEFIYVD